MVTAKQNAGHKLEAQNEDLLNKLARLAYLTGARMRRIHATSSTGTTCSYDIHWK